MWIKYHSTALDMEYVYSDKLDQIWTEDGVGYKSSELNILEKTGSYITKEVHELKKMFEGEIIG